MSGPAPEQGAWIADCGDCPYLPARRFLALVTALDGNAGRGYRSLLDRNFRRNGSHAYRPVCQGCDACRQLRLRAAAFTPRRDQRRCARRNADLRISVAPPGFDDERLGLWARYQQTVHGKADQEPGDFLEAPPGLEAIELHARDAAGRLLAVSCCDRFDDALSSIYCYWEPTERARSLGTLMILAEIDHCRDNGLEWLYLGFHIADCPTMAYKGRFGPCEVLVDGTWTPLGLWPSA